jgi:hypothetical protein
MSAPCPLSPTACVFCSFFSPPPHCTPTPTIPHTHRYMNDKLAIPVWNYNVSSVYRWSNYQARCFFNASLSSGEYFQETILGAWGHKRGNGSIDA